MTSLEVTVVEWLHPDAVLLRREFEDEMQGRYSAQLSARPTLAEEQEAELDPDTIRCTVIARWDGEPVAHAAVQDTGADWEVRRVYTRPTARRRGVSQALLGALERHATEAGLPRLILGTGALQPEAIALYVREGWTRIDSFAPEEFADLALCFEKVLHPSAAVRTPA